MLMIVKDILIKGIVRVVQYTLDLLLRILVIVLHIFVLCICRQVHSVFSMNLIIKEDIPLLILVLSPLISAITMEVEDNA
jgi:predicted neutral ceramidase superfamily lipid hydrolase